MRHPLGCLREGAHRCSDQHDRRHGLRQNNPRLLLLRGRREEKADRHHTLQSHSDGRPADRFRLEGGSQGRAKVSLRHPVQNDGEGFLGLLRHGQFQHEIGLRFQRHKNGRWHVPLQCGGGRSGCQVYRAVGAVRVRPHRQQRPDVGRRVCLLRVRLHPLPHALPLVCQHGHAADLPLLAARLLRLPRHRTDRLFRAAAHPHHLPRAGCRRRRRVRLRGLVEAGAGADRARHDVQAHFVDVEPLCAVRLHHLDHDGARFLLDGHHTGDADFVIRDLRSHRHRDELHPDRHLLPARRAGGRDRDHHVLGQVPAKASARARAHGPRRAAAFQPAPQHEQFLRLEN
mmetsp:Transcript_44318/g.109737  ORF Transcript_44318/g.109737 Transcript_44318/m.109737 type:complete len:343 (-) Transcript_44318:2880-3908(-)